MNPIELARAFREGRVIGPRGPVAVKAALVTRRSLVLFTAQTVLKLRLPERVGDADQSLRSVRVAMAERERFIGRQLAPHAYLDDCGLKLDEDGGLRFVHEEPDAEPIVATWRQPLERRADELVAAGAVGPDDFHPVMAALARFHEDAGEPRPEDRYVEPSRTVQRWAAALGSLEAAADDVVSADERRRLADETAGWLAELDKVLLHRIMERRLREAHGNLALEHVFLVDPPVFIDAADHGTTGDLIVDTAEDVMTLAMELELAAGPELADAAVARYAAHAYDPRLGLVAPLFKRLAAVRAAAEAATDPMLEDGPARARALVELALGTSLARR